MPFNLAIIKYMYRKLFNIKKMSNTTSPKTAFALYLQLIFGLFKPDNLWLCPQFRTKFFLRSLLFPITTFQYLNSLVNSPSMCQALNNQGLLPSKIHRPYLKAGLSVSERAKAIIGHYNFVQSIKNDYFRELLQAREEKIFLTFLGKDSQRFDINICSGYFDREGEVTFVLKYNDTLLSSLSFSFINMNGLPSILIGGLQGPRKDVGNKKIHEATKSIFGLFPKRILMEVFLCFSGHCGIKKIYAVSEYNHVFYSLRYRKSKGKVFFSSYSEFWLSLSGNLISEGLYELPLSIPRKGLEVVASKKRSEYRKRYELLDDLSDRMFDNIKALPIK